jgi:hypothetical protein
VRTDGTEPIVGLPADQPVALSSVNLQRGTEPTAITVVPVLSQKHPMHIFTVGIP